MIDPRFVLLAPGLALLCLLAAQSAAGAGDGLPDGFVYLRDVDGTIAQDMRYAGENNFMGRAAPGYQAGECILADQAAQALKRVQRALKPQGLSLKVYDCYRPARAVRAFVDWARSPAPEADPKRSSYYPHLTRPELLAQEYIAAPSGHSLGTAVDLTIIPASSSPPQAGADSSTAVGPCTAPLGERAPDTGVDMGTGFDCFDPLSHTANPKIEDEQRRWRRLLVDAMGPEGFQNYPKEWWHFSLSLPGYDKHLDFPISPRPTGE